MPPSPRAERRDVMLVPYAVLASVYLATYNPFRHVPPETLTAAALKAAPIWYLALYVGTATPRFPTNPLAGAVRAGLALSSLGDVCLVWRSSLFLPGMFCFALAHLAYVHGLRTWLRQGGHHPAGGAYVREMVATCAVSYLFLFPGMESWVMAAIVLGYMLLLFAMTYFSVQRHLAERDLASLSGLVGAAAFDVSDFLIGVARWQLRFPFSEALIMVVYYFAQGAIAFGAVNSARGRRRE